jgi:hypothetical protein
MSPHQCAEKDPLLSEYRKTTNLYSAAVAELTRMIGVSSIDDYRQLHNAAEKARLHSIEARDRLARHYAEHHCDSSSESLSA